MLISELRTWCTESTSETLRTRWGPTNVYNL